MAENKEQYLFSVDADVTNALGNLEKVAKLMQTIERLRNKGADDYNTTNQKDMDKNMRSMRQLTKQYSDMQKELSDIARKLQDTAEEMTIPEGASREQSKLINQQKREAQEYADTIKQQQASIRDEYRRTLGRFREMANMQQNYSKNFKHIFNSNDVRNLPTGKDNFDRARNIVSSMANDVDGVESKLNNVLGKIREVTKLDRRAESLSRRASASGYMSTQQAASFRDDHHTVNNKYVGQRAENISQLTALGQQRKELHDSIKRIELNPLASQSDIDRKIAMQQSVESIDKEWEARMELNRLLNQSIDNMKRYNASVQGVEQKPERGTFRGMVYERAPAIGLALTAAMGGTVASLYNQGAGNSRAMRPDEISIGQRTDTAGDLWRSGIRNGALEGGLKDRLGFSGQEMMAFQNNYLSNSGYEGMKDLNSAMMNQAKFSRVTGLSSTDTNDFFSSVFGTGAVNGNQVSDIQDAFVGAIKQSGMEGREKDQIKALDGILKGVGQGRTLTNQEVMNTMGLQSVLASSGQRSLRGQQGGDLLSGINSGIRQGFEDPMVRLVFGQGTKYQGVAGRFDLRKQMDKGISDVGNVSTIAKFAEQMGGKNKDAQNEAFASFVQEKLGTQITGEQAQGMMDLYRNGQLDQKHLNKVISADEATGKETSKKRMDEYKKSNASIDNESDATTQKQATELYDLGEPLRKLNSNLGGLPPAMYALTAAIGALALTIATSGGSFGMARGVRTLARGRFSTETPAAGGWFSRMFGRGRGGGSSTPPPTGGGGGAAAVEGGMVRTAGGLWVPADAAAGATRTATAANTRTYATPPRGVRGTVASWFDPNVRRGGLANSGPSPSATAGATATTAVESGGKGFLNSLGGLAKGAGKVVGKIALPLAIGMGIMDVAKAKSNEKGKATGKAAGGILGGIGGGILAGAAAGSIIPGAGTLVGAGIGLVGGIAGSLFGSKVGGGIGSWFDPKKAEAAELSPAELKAAEAKRKGANNTAEQTDKENTNTKQRTESKKSANLQYERENLHSWDSLLTRMSQILAQARSQNGIVGNPNGTGGGDGDGGSDPGSGGGGAGTAKGKGNASKIWNFFSGKGMSSGAIAGILGNLQQESGLDPTKKGGGLAQWIGSRQKDLQAYAKKTGGDPKSLETQLNFMWKEMSSGKYGDYSKMNKMSASDAAQYFEENYEKAGKPMMANRKKYAKNWYKEYGSSAQWDSAGVTKSNKSSSSSKSVNATITVNVKGDEKVSSKVKNSKDMKDTGRAINQMIFGVDYYSKEMRMV